MIRILIAAVLAWVLAGGAVLLAVDVLASHYAGKPSWVSTVAGS